MRASLIRPLLVLAAGLLALGGCTPGKPHQRFSAAKLAKQYTEAWSSKDPARVAAFYAPEGSLTINGGTPSVGRDAITETARGFMTSFPDMVVTMDDLFVDGNGYVYRWTLTGTNSGPGGTGKRVNISGQERWSLDNDGLIAKSVGSFDAKEYQRQLAEGAPPPPAEPLGFRLKRRR
jgi:uncharacterized protein (TIGR02246 family)